MSVAVTEPKRVPVSPAVRALLTALGDVRQERHLTRPLDRDCDLPLVAPAGAGDPPRADLPFLRDVAAKLVRVLPVDLLDLHPAEPAVLLPDRSGGGTAASALLLPVFLLSHQRSPADWLGLSGRENQVSQGRRERS